MDKGEISVRQIFPTSQPTAKSVHPHLSICLTMPMFPQQTAQRIRQAITAAVTYVFHHPKPAAAHQTQRGCPHAQHRGWRQRRHPDLI
jgi:hypothetical protein